MYRLCFCHYCFGIYTRKTVYNIERNKTEIEREEERARERERERKRDRERKKVSGDKSIDFS